MHYSFPLFFSQSVLHVRVSATAQLRVRWRFTQAVTPTSLAMVRREWGDFEVFRLLIPAMAALLNSLMCTDRSLPCALHELLPKASECSWLSHWCLELWLIKQHSNIGLIVLVTVFLPKPYLLFPGASWSESTIFSISRSFVCVGFCVGCGAVWT